MTPNQVSKELRLVAEKRRGEDTPTFGIRISDMADEAANAIDELLLIVNRIALLSSCNDCSIKPCRVMPAWGEEVRYNCHLHRPIKCNHLEAIPDDKYIYSRPNMRAYHEYILEFARNHNISLDIAEQHPMVKARLEYYNQTGL